MITFVSMENLAGNMEAIKAQHKLRYKSFLERQSYKVHSYNCMEYDQYDNPSAVYLIYKSEKSNTALGVSRLTPTSHRSMLKDLFPEMVDDHSIYGQSCVWEGTRFCVEKDISPALRRQVIDHLVGAYFEFGFYFGVKKIIGMMPTFILKNIFGKSGCVYEPVGPAVKIDGHRVQAASLEISTQNFELFKSHTGLRSPFIMNLHREDTQAA